MKSKYLKVDLCGGCPRIFKEGKKEGRKEGKRLRKEGRNEWW